MAAHEAPPALTLTFMGAAREVTGSCHLVEAGGTTVALDCGLFQGRRAESRAKNEQLPCDPDTLSALVLSHAHIDHAGRLPFLVAQGWRGDIFATAATRDLCGLMLRDSAHIQAKDAEYLARRDRPHAEPLYDLAAVDRTMDLMTGVPLRRPTPVLPGWTATFHEAGHILGSASVTLDVPTPAGPRRVCFSGDIGRWGMDIIRDPDPPEGADVVILESTYGNRDHTPTADARQRLATIVRETASRGGRVLIPAFAVGRTQELLYDLHALYREGAIPRLPIAVDSPLAIDATGIFEANRELFDRAEPLMQALRNPFDFELVHYTRTVEQSKALNTGRGPAVIIAASGMCESGRILHHLQHGASDPRNTILICGFQAEHTLGRRIVERRPELRILGEDVALRARVEVLDGYSAHADRTDLHRWLAAVRARSPRLQRVCLVHGEPPAMDAFAERLRAEGLAVDTPAPGASIAIR
ncbi:MAG: MBL fold metallo-hydrolase [Gemmatimonadaceae bacterium]|nr:MBL fold metallo-hydrolase [Gemmatimonadaceae bacterium]